MRHPDRRLMFLAACCCWWHSIAFAQTPVWRQDWTVSTPPTMATGLFATEQASGPFTVRFADNGDLLMSTLSYAGGDSHVFRYGADGHYLWAVNLAADEGYEVPLPYPASDGGGFVVTERNDSLVGIDAEGKFKWTRRVPAKLMATLPGNAIAVATCKRVTVLDGISGNMRWQARLPESPPNCSMTELLADGNANLFATLRNDSYCDANGSRLLKFDTNGQQLWRFDVAGESARLVGVDAGHAYLATPTRQMAIDTASGKLIWQSTFELVHSLFVPGNPVLLVAIAADAVSGIDAVSGALLWTQAVVVSDIAEVVGNAVLVNTSSGLVKLDAVTGFVQWTMPLPENDAYGHIVDSWIALGGLKDGAFLAIGRATAPGAQPPPVVQRINFLDGQLLAELSLPAILQGRFPAKHLFAGKVIALGVEPDAYATRYRLSSTDASNGSELWTRLELPFDSGLVNSSYRPGFQITAANDTIVATVDEGGYPKSDVAVSAWQLADGERLWQTPLRPAFENWFNSGISAPKINAGSDVLLSLVTRIECLPPEYCARTVVYKLDGNDGLIDWQYAQDYVWQGPEPPYLTAPVFTEFADDVIAVGRWGSLVRLDGTSGLVEWTADTFDFGLTPSLHATADGNVIAVGYSRWGKIDASTGLLIWSGVSPIQTCHPYHCSVLKTTLLANGDLLQVGSRSENSGARTPFVALLHADGTGSSEVWFLDSGSASSISILSVEIDALGEIWMGIREQRSGIPFVMYYLARFDLATQTLQARQSLGLRPYNALAVSEVSYLSFGAPVADRLLAANYTRQSPLPVTDGVVLLDSAIKAHGNLSIETRLAEGPVMPGESASFNVRVDYSGDGAVDSAQVAISLPWGSTIAGLGCLSTSPGTCKLRTASGDIQATFAIAPNGRVDIRGELQVLDGDDPEPTLSAVVQGSIGLMESDTTDNFSLARIVQSIFHDGFDISAPR